ncbi:MAG TPA: hypothetical protein VLL97_06560 [Acidobacteriota bacterium]|nr:hypothetical protein [Acidobacteriota bacterium]
MNRTPLFLLLTMLLLALIAFLVIKGQNTLKERPARTAESVDESTPSPTRVFAPRDLAITASEMTSGDISGKEQQPATTTAIHRVEINNKGDVLYQNLQLRIEYLDQSGGVLDTRTLIIERDFDPDSLVVLDDVVIEAVPAAASGFRMTIVYADMGMTVN